MPKFDEGGDPQASLMKVRILSNENRLNCLADFTSDFFQKSFI